MKILILIPSYNDSNYLPDLVQRIQKTTDLPILVVDDGSKIPITFSDENVHILRNKANLGKGAALKNGFLYAYGKGYSHAITMDSDLQHDPNKLIDFIEFDEHFELVYGRRTTDKQMPLHRKLSNKITSWIISMVCGQQIYDSQCGYRRYNIHSVLEAQCKENGFQFESEVLIKLTRGDSSIGHVIIPTIYGNETSSIRNIQDTYKFIKLILGNIWQKRSYLI